MQGIATSVKDTVKDKIIDDNAAERGKFTGEATFTILLTALTAGFGSEASVGSKTASLSDDVARATGNLSDDVGRVAGATDDIARVTEGLGDDVARVAESPVDELVEGVNGTINDFDKTVNIGKQGKHIVGNNNYIEGRSIFNGTTNDAQKLVDEFAGTGKLIGQNKERIDFGKVIGKYVNPTTGESIDTTVGIIHYSKTGTHIVPAQPIK